MFMEKIQCYSVVLEIFCPGKSGKIAHLHSENSRHSMLQINM